MTEQSTLSIFFFGLLVLSVVFYLWGRSKSATLAKAGGDWHSRPGQHGSYVVCWLLVPAVILGLSAALLHLTGFAKIPGLWILALTFACGLVGAAYALTRIQPGLRARNGVERVIRSVLLAASIVSIFVTFGIVASILFESLAFFSGKYDRNAWSVRWNEVGNQQSIIGSGTEMSMEITVSDGSSTKRELQTVYARLLDTEEPSFSLNFKGVSTSPFPPGASAPAVEEALNGLPGIEAAGGVTVAKDIWERPPVHPKDFLTGTTWAPENSFLATVASPGDDGASYAKPQFGAVPLFAGTFMITLIAVIVAVPVGVMAAIFMTQYMPFRVRQGVKPILEILAGIPTVVYGFFAVVTIGPSVVTVCDWGLGLLTYQEAGETVVRAGWGWLATFLETASPENALTCGLVMGIMIIPLVSSLSDDVINSVPNAIREGSLALGTTRAETIKNVILPAALPGVVSAILLAISRALGETMIVFMAAGAQPNLSANPLEGMTTVTVRMATAFTGDKAVESLETLSAFALGLVLFIITLILNVVATIVIRRFRQRY